MLLPLDDDEARRLFEQLEDEQAAAGLLHIASTAARFRQHLNDLGFSSNESFWLCRDMLNALMDFLPAETTES